MNEKQLEYLDYIRKLVQVIKPKTHVEKDIIDMIDNLIIDIKALNKNE